MADGENPASADPADLTRQNRRVEGAEPVSPDRRFIVGVGASAGGLDALAELVGNVPVDHMAFVVVQHLAPDYASQLTELLGRVTRIKVVTAAEGMTVEANHVYVIPPNCELVVMHGVLHLMAPRRGNRPTLPIDYFFRSLAEDQGAAAVGIVLSGTGTDGTFGLKAIKAAGGITFAQEPSSAKYDGMPRSALASGYADFCLTPSEIANELTRISQHPYVRRSTKTEALPANLQERLAKLFFLVRSEFGNDLTHYKLTTIERRIERRMAMHKVGRLEDYVRYVESSPDELRALYKDLLITVTNFFRDQYPFEELKTKVFPHILQNRDLAAPIRVWVPGCATGEEAYSLAISLLELMEEKGSEAPLQIFGTDIDSDSIQHARRGIYPQNIALDVCPERLHRFFNKVDDEYQVSRRVRDAVVFSRHNLLKDAPFSRMDLVSCRNLLIYFQPPAQSKALRILHYALNPSGFLMLGGSETVGDVPDLFSLVDRKGKLYSKKHAGSVRPDLGFGASGSPVEGAQISPAPRPAITLQMLVDRKVLDTYAPPGVVINENLEVLSFRGRTGPYLDPSPGAASFHILRIARPELHADLKRTIERALSERLQVSTDVTLYEEGKPTALRIDVLPIQEPERRTQCLLVSFLELTPPKEIPVVLAEEAQGDERLRPLAARLQELERELAATKEYLQITIHEKETSGEELKSANEELQSSNEELQSTNEELETSKEEMQSTNEELTTVNEELQNRMAELSQSTDDFDNILAAVDVAILIVGMDLRIRRFTASAERVLNLIAADVGRSVSFLNPFFGNGDLDAKVSAVVESLSTYEEELMGSDRRWYALQITPYRTMDHSIRGAVISLTDIDIRKKTADLTRNIAEYAGRFVAAIDHPVLLVDSRLRVLWANDLFYAAFRATPEQTVGGVFYNIAALPGADSDLRKLINATIAEGTAFRGYKVKQSFPAGSKGTIKVGASRLPVVSDPVMALISIEEDLDSRARERPS
jgi:two-component system CheB/CheR fusion protein